MNNNNNSSTVLSFVRKLHKLPNATTFESKTMLAFEAVTAHAIKTKARKTVNKNYASLRMTSFDISYACCRVLDDSELYW